MALTKKEIEKILKDYHWMLNSIKIMREAMDEGAYISSKIPMYGLDAAMPKPKGYTGDPVYADVIRRSKHWKKIEWYEKAVKYIQERIDRIKDERESEVLYWLLEGKSYRWIGNHMGLSFAHIKRIRDSIVDQLSDEANVTNDTNGTDDTKETNFRKQKTAC